MKSAPRTSAAEAGTICGVPALPIDAADFSATVCVAARDLARMAGVPRDPGKNWESRYALLVSFVSRTGHARVPDRHIDEGGRLGNWVRTPRHIHRRGRLPGDRSKSPRPFDR